MTLSIPDQAVLDSLTDFDSVKEKIGCRLINAERNADALSDRPYTLVDDLAVTYHIDLGKSESGQMSTPVTNRLLEMYGVDTEQLHGIALGNMETLSPASFKGMSETMAELMPPEMESMAPDGMSLEEATAAVKSMFSQERETMYVLSNKEKLHGAAALLNERIMDEITGTIGQEYYILPSSIHEVLIVPKTEGMDLKSLEEMVHDVNTTQVSPHERLSDHVYAYDAKEHRLFRADKEAERSMDRKPSISDALRAPLPETASHAVKPPVAGDDAR